MFNLDIIQVKYKRFRDLQTHVQIVLQKDYEVIYESLFLILIFIELYFLLVSF
jgi:hypothetical protein